VTERRVAGEARSPGRRRRALGLALRGVISAACLLALVRLVPWGTLAEAFARVPAAHFLAVVAAFLALHAFGSFKWRVALAAAGARLGWRAGVECYSAGLFSNLFLPSIVGGDVLRALLAGRRSGRIEAAVLGGVADRLLDVSALCALALGASLWVGAGSDGAWRALLVLGALLCVAVALAALPLLLRRPLSRWPARIRGRVAQALVALRRQRRRPGALAFCFLAAVAMQFALVLLNRVLGGALGVEASLPEWLFAFALAKVAGLLPVSFNGIGVRDSAFAALLVPLLDNEGWSRDERWAHAIATSLAWQAVLIAGGLVSGALWRIAARGGSGRA
jgi:uncharacterized membrane protein YbhN (UPF0104 family)